MRRLFPVLVLLGVVATASLLLAPMEHLMPARLHMDPLAFRALTLVQPIVLMVLFVAGGCWAAPKVGLDAPLVRAVLDRQPVAPVLRRQIGPALLTGLAVAATLLFYGYYTADWFRGSPAASFDIPLLPKLLYGGIGEELLTRWGAMSLIALLAWKVGGGARPVPAVCFRIAAAVAALLFAAGHLPLLYMLMPGVRPELVGAVLIGNAVPGFLFGIVFWKRGLEAAMIAHATAHLVAVTVTAVL